MNKIPTPEDITQTCATLASRLILDESSRTECKLALVDLLDEALQGTKFHSVWVYFRFRSVQTLYTNLPNPSQPVNPRRI